MNTLTLIHTPWLTLQLAWPRRRNAPRATVRSKPVVRIAGLR